MPRLVPPDRKDHILDAAIRCWLEHGFDATTVEAIAREAGVAKGTVYLSFPAKRDILDAAIERHSMLPDLERALTALARRPATELVPVLVRAIWHALVARLPVIQLLVRELVIRPEHARTFIERVVLPSNEALAARLAADPALAASGVDLFVASRALVGMVMIFLFTQEVFGGRELRPIDEDALVATIARVFLFGVAGRRPS